MIFLTLMLLCGNRIECPKDPINMAVQWNQESVGETLRLTIHKVLYCCD